MAIAIYILLLLLGAAGLFYFASRAIRFLEDKEYKHFDRIERKRIEREGKI